MDPKSTLLLPQTDFPMRANLAQLEPKILERWEKADTYGKWMERNGDKPRFIFHDGPPYANGRIHHGHFLNKILKDIVAKFRNMSGHHCDFVPGWDCHGLPIELVVDKELGGKKREMSRVALRREYRKHAEKYVGIQREDFKRLGVFARWERPYLTMSPGYEAQTVRELGKFAERGSLFRGKKPVHWCMKDRTALAEAEVEYENHRSPTIFVGFPLSGDPARLSSSLAGKKVEFIIWTTTPWTLPANLAISVHPDFTYVAYELRNRVVIVAKELLAKFLEECAPEELSGKQVALPTAGSTESAFDVAALAHPTRVLAYFEGKTLERLEYDHVFLPRKGIVILGEHVTLEAGSGLVHTAPGHGVDDYQVGLKYKLEILTPVDAAGKLTAEAGEFAGLGVFEANPKIIEKLHASGALWSKPEANFEHSYPHCWRCKSPIIFRATDQWFIGMEQNQLRAKCLEAIQSVNWIPAWGQARIHGMLVNRPDWCISRQRTWGVPITVVYCESPGCDHVLIEKEIFDKAAEVFESETADAWYARPVTDFLPHGKQCPKCKGTSFRAEQDILDVWFDSGVSFAAVAEKENGPDSQVDLYLEGSDQHRGWFHSTLMCSVGTRDRKPYKSVLTHGFIVDEEGRKYSKSNPKFVPPEALVKKWGTEMMRLWVSSTDYRNDIHFSEQLLEKLSDAYRKIRNTIRYGLSNLHGFDPQQHAVKESELLPLDAWALHTARVALAKMRRAYEEYEFHLVFQTAQELCASTLSATYFDVLKDRLYTFKAAGLERRSAQTVIHLITRDLLVMLAPVLSFTAEEAYQHLPGNRLDSVFFEPMAPATVGEPSAEVGAVDRALALRASFSAAMESFRQAGNAPVDARVTLPAAAVEGFSKALIEGLPEMFAVSQVAIGEAISVDKADGTQCPRCRRWVNESLVEGGFCARCEAQGPFAAVEKSS